MAKLIQKKRRRKLKTTMAQAIAHVRYARYGPRKVASVLDQIRGKSAQRALTLLEFLPRRSRHLVAAALRSAMYNLSGKAGRIVEPKDIWVKSCWINQAPVLKRIHTGSMGRAFGYRRKMCHLTVVVTD